MDIAQGLFKLDLTDYHAILGISLEAEPKQVRKRYLKIARKLHPDSLSGASDTEKQQASELLSKMVNPAYEKLSQEKESSEYQVVLRMQGQQLSRQNNLVLETEAAQALAKSNNVDHAYNMALKALVDQQYESLDDVPEIIGKISELNAVYLMRKSGSATGGSAPAAAPATSATAGAAPTNGAAPTAAAPPPPAARPKRQNLAEGYLNRAKEFEMRKDFSRAILELREAVKSFPTNPDCHSHLANAYLKAGQSTMAKIHSNKALDLDPENQLGAMVKKSVERKTGGSQAGKAEKSKGGLFGLFGGKKK
jgi:curved DNA-binding protein CbpA